MNALVVGGSGPTGQHIVEGLGARGYDVTVLHRGVHENPEIAHVRHLHADPHFAEPVKSVLGDERFDVVVVAYGRLKVLTDVFAGRCDRLVAIGGMAIYDGFLSPASRVPAGMRLPATEESGLAVPERIPDDRTAAFAQKLLDAEAAVMRAHEAGGFAATIVRYPLIYGPRSVVPHEWSIVKRIADGREFLLLPEAGLGITARCAAENAAHCVLLAVDTPAAAGEAFNCADDELLSLASWAELVMESLGERLEFVSVPHSMRWVAAHFLPWAGTTSEHAFVDWSKARRMLGYEPVVTARDAVARTARWYRDHPIADVPCPGTGDRFDYAAEEGVREQLLRLEVVGAVPAWQDEPTHVYAHPRTPGLGVDHRGR